MLESQLFTKLRREAPKDEIARNAKLLIRAGFMDKLQAGVYTYLPLGFLVLKKIENIIREEMLSMGAQEIFMPSLHPKDNWEQTGRWVSMGDLYKLKDTSGKEFALAPTHEEVVVPLVKQFVSSYKDLPMSVFQIQNKFRMELRAKSGMLRGREFLMKDLYSFHTDQDDADSFYEVSKGVYNKIFERTGLGEYTYLTFASGGSFCEYSHEFQTITDAGEDTIYICDKCKVAINKEIKHEYNECPACGGEAFTEKKSIEVGNIFPLKTKFSDAFDLVYKDEKGEKKSVYMGCYGIGLSRLMGAVVEVFADDKGLVWPESVAPFKFHLIPVGESEDVAKSSRELYKRMKDGGLDVLFNDHMHQSAGEKFAGADLVGIPYRVVVSEKSLKEGKIEVKKRTDNTPQYVEEEELFKR